MNLIKSLQQTQTQRAEQPIPGQAANLRKMLAAKSGKAGATSGPAQSNIQEQQALVDFGAAATQQQQAGQLAVGQQQLAEQGQQQQTAQAFDRLGQQNAETQQKYRQAVTEINNKLKRLADDIESKEGRAALNEALFIKRLSDTKYITELQRQGQVRRLQDAQQFQIEAGKQAFEDWKTLFTDEQEFAKIMRMDNAEFQKSIARMGIDQARAILQSNMEAANTQTLWKAGGDFVMGGVEAAVAADKAGMFNSTPQPQTPTSTSQMNINQPSNLKPGAGSQPILG